MNKGDLVTISGHTGTVLDIVETETQQTVKLELKDGRVATFVYTRNVKGLDGMRLG